MEILKNAITKADVLAMARASGGEMVKGVADLGRGLLALDAELHSDLEALLLDDGAEQDKLWGINLFPEKEGAEYLIFDSVINIRPWQGNRGLGVDDGTTREEIRKVVAQWVRG